MSTKSLLYHGFALGVVECTRTEYINGEITFHIRHPQDRVRCPCCHSGDLIYRGTVTRTLRIPPIGRSKSMCSGGRPVRLADTAVTP